jgi:glycosyltransferase involved in cell wall biosynthesis
MNSRADPGVRREPLSVLHVAQPSDGGVAAYVAAACSDQLARGWTVAVACPEGGRLATDLVARGVPWLRWAAGRAPGPASIAEAVRLRRLIARVRPDVVHLHSSKAGLTGRLAVRGRRATLFQPHGWSWLAVDGATAAATIRWERFAARWTDLLVCVGAGEAEQGRTHRVRGRYVVVRNGVDLTRFRPVGDAKAASRAQIGVQSHVPLAVCVGRVTRQKGQDVLLAAWPSVRARCPEAELCVVGNGDLLPELRARSPAGVRFAVTDDVRPWYGAADVVVLPSRWEGLSLTLLEALASGRPVVAAAVPGLAEALPSGAGALVPPEDPGVLANEILRRLTDPGLVLTEAVAAARQAVEFDVRRTFDRLAAVTEQIAQVRQKPAVPQDAV